MTRRPVILAACALLTLGAADPLPVGPVGRYQLQPGTIQRAAGPEPVLVRIDTTTGDTWQLLELPAGPGRYVVGWVPIFPDAIAAATSATRARPSP